VFQEIDVETGELLFEWRATDHISMRDVYTTPNRKDGYGTSKDDAFDFFHINSVDKTESGDYIISARYMHAVVCVSGTTGELLWQLGGKNNNFEDLSGGAALDFAWQHHVRWLGNGTISLFDNHRNTVVHGPSVHSKGLIVRVDLETMTVDFVGKYVHPDRILNVSQGSVQLVENGNVLVGFGNSPTYVEYKPSGEVLCSAHFAPHLAFELVDFGLVKSYRIFKKQWKGRPNTQPDVKAKDGRVYVSWNGATEVAGWRVERAANGLDAENDEFVSIKDVKRSGFETTIDLKKEELGHIRVVALDAANSVMARSVAIKAHPASSVRFSLLVSLRPQQFHYMVAIALNTNMFL
jgi:hypothetical protein